jgi:molybdopterin molybdotransferase
VRVYICVYRGDHLLNVRTPDEVLKLISKTFSITMPGELLDITEAGGRILAVDISAEDFVPDFNRSTVDGYAVMASDTFGCSESIPALLPLIGEIKMGDAAAEPLQSGFCMAVPTGGDVPDGADAVVMLEYTEDYGDGTIGVTKPAAPGENLIFRGDDISPGQILFRSGHRFVAHDIGALAALGIRSVLVRTRPVVGIISTGDELVDCSVKPHKGQIRDVNSMLLAAAVTEMGCQAKLYGILKDDESLLEAAAAQACASCDMVLISGGSSVGMKDATARVIERGGRILLHGIAMKPGKPTILGIMKGKPVFGLPGHPVATYFITRLFVRALIERLLGSEYRPRTISARLGMAVSSNHGRAEYMGVRLEEAPELITAHPVRGKSGLITSLSGTDGYICIPRDCEGFPRNAVVPVTLWD